MLLWDNRYLSEAIREYEYLLEKHPHNFGFSHQLARLLAKDRRRNDDAIREFERLVKKRPHDMALREEYARVLAKNRSHFHTAKKQFEIVLRKKSGFTTRLAYAELLARGRSTRDEALAQYGKLVTEDSRNTHVRLKYAKLLGAEKENLDRAIKQYKIILKEEEHNVAAHRGIAHAYAWHGYNDKAVHHSNLALQIGHEHPDVSKLRRDLMKGREPSLGAGFSFVNQPSGDYRLNGFTLSAWYKSDFTPFLTNYIEIGEESYWNSDNDLNGVLFRISTQYRIDPKRRIDGSYGFHSLKRFGDGNEFSIRYTCERPKVTISSGFKRELKYESIPALGGDTDESTRAKIGSAISNTFFSEFTYRYGRVTSTGTPYIGYVSARSTPTTTIIGADADVRFLIKSSGPLQISAVYLFRIYHYEHDNSGFLYSEEEPFGGGYFSPYLFCNNTFNVEFRYTIGEKHRFGFRGGPRYQYVKESSNTSDSHVGLDIHLSYIRKLLKPFRWHVTVDYTKVADVYTRFIMASMVSYTF